MEIIDLPHDVFLLIVAQLPARNTVLCRQVSKRWNAAFTDQDFSFQLLKWHFPRCREMRIAYADTGGDISGTTDGLSPQDDQMLVGEADRQILDWTSTFAQVASRYHHLRTATPRSVSKVRLGTTSSGPDHPQGPFFGVATWDRYLRLDNKTASFHYPDPSWCYSQDAGLLVYHTHPDDVRPDVSAARSYVYPWRLLALASCEEFEIPFPHSDGRIVRRVRLAEGVLLFEWCEREAYNWRVEQTHRHYATILDVVRTTTLPPPSTAGWTITPRHEFQLFSLPLNTHDRFLSAHINTHYAVYVWRHNEGNPIEVVYIWDITSSPPKIVRRLWQTRLDVYEVRQWRTPTLRSLGMDERNLYFVEEEHRWAQGSHSSVSLPRVHMVRSTGIPLIPGPVDRLLPSGLGDGAGDGHKYGDDEEEEVIVQGPRWFDQCGANGDVNLSFCSRVYPRPHTHPNLVHQHGVSATSPAIWNGSLPSTTSTPAIPVEIAAAVRAPTTRWPGWAPCWRHEEFPYLTVSEMVDFKAGVRVTARHCFMLETLSVHVRPSLSVRGLGYGGGGGGSVCSASSAEDVDDQGSNRDNTEGTLDSRPNGRHDVTDNAVSAARGDGRNKKAAAEEESSRHREKQFADEFWGELLGKGFICGDERWLLGEDRNGMVTIVRF